MRKAVATSLNKKLGDFVFSSLMGFFLLIVPPLLIMLGCDAVEERESRIDSSKQVRFTDVTDQVGLDFQHESGADGSYFMPESVGSGAALLDYDNDGDLDIYLVNGAHHGTKGGSTVSPRNRLYRQEDEGTFEDVTGDAGLGDTGYGMGVAVGDLDNDGDLDMYLSNYGRDQLYQNNGDGAFANISEQAGISNPDWGCSVLFLDYNLDTHLDIFVTNYVAWDPASVCPDRSGRQDYCSPEGFPGVPDLLFHNNGDGTFTDVSGESGITAAASKGLGVVSGDFNNDQHPDLYVANDGEANNLWLNQGNGTFQDHGISLGVALNDVGRAEAGMGVAIGDVDNDENLDLFVAHLRKESNTLYRYAGDFGFQDESSPSGLGAASLPYTGFGAGFLDFDHDGDLDLAVANGRVSRGPLLTGKGTSSYWDHYAEPNFLFENDGVGRFQSVGEQTTDFCRSIENSRGLAFGDIDNDGDVDLLVNNTGSRARLFRNDSRPAGRWLNVRAVDPDLNRDALGARVTIVLSARRISRLIAPAYSFLSSNDARAHFGLGAANQVDEIHVEWPGGVVETFPGVQADQFVTLRKGQSPQGNE